MTPLVTMEQAKSHLRITDDLSDDDVQAKLDQASTIILNYLKVRYTAIASVSVANPTVVTTSVPHSLVSGVTATIADTSTTPTINGAQVITVTGTKTFTVPVNVTAGQTSAAGTVSTPTWTLATVPSPVAAGILLVLEDLYERRPIGWESIGALLIRYRDPAVA